MGTRAQSCPLPGRISSMLCRELPHSVRQSTRRVERRVAARLDPEVTARYDWSGMTTARALTLTSEPIGVTSGWPTAVKFAMQRRDGGNLRPILRRNTNPPAGRKLIVDPGFCRTVKSVSFPLVTARSDSGRLCPCADPQTLCGRQIGPECPAGGYSRID